MWMSINPNPNMLPWITQEVLMTVANKSSKLKYYQKILFNDLFWLNNAITMSKYSRNYIYSIYIMHA